MKFDKEFVEQLGKEFDGEFGKDSNIRFRIKMCIRKVTEPDCFKHRRDVQ